MTQNALQKSLLLSSVLSCPLFISGCSKDQEEDPYGETSINVSDQHSPSSDTPEDSE